MQTHTLEHAARTVEEAVVACYGHYRAEAAKRGRNPAWPYVPVIRWSDSGYGQTQQIQGKAFATRDEAVAYAGRYIDALKSKMAANLAEPRCRALRRQWGVDEEGA